MQATRKLTAGELDQVLIGLEQRHEVLRTHVEEHTRKGDVSLTAYYQRQLDSCKSAFTYFLEFRKD